MNTLEIEVMTLNYMGKLTVEPLNNEFSIFAVYLDRQLLGLVHPAKKQHQTAWYSQQITDKELLEQIGNWLEFHFVLGPESFKTIYSFSFIGRVARLYRMIGRWNSPVPTHPLCRLD
ncbi:hypothetical protein [Pedobacter sp. L105]|uniref:hypothetical protein n=1 Tax=Pedobacter sp. L105 TaxID=1641871 RepID=UPI00131B004A|nr:hypothetical protein [Pedobacter sp. L105]